MVPSISRYGELTVPPSHFGSGPNSILTVGLNRYSNLNNFIVHLSIVIRIEIKPRQCLTFYSRLLNATLFTKTNPFPIIQLPSDFSWKFSRIPRLLSQRVSRQHIPSHS